MRGNQDKLIKRAIAICKDLIHWSETPAGEMTRCGINEFQFLAEVVIPKADRFLELTSKDHTRDDEPINGFKWHDIKTNPPKFGRYLGVSKRDESVHIFWIEPNGVGFQNCSHWAAIPEFTL